MQKDYSRLSVDEATQLLNDFYQTRYDNLADPRKGVMRTLFNVAAYVFNAAKLEEMATLEDTVLTLNGIEKIEAENVCHNYLPEIVTAAEARGSTAVEGIKLYNELVTAADRQARATEGYEKMSWFAQMKLSIKLGKEIAKKMSP